MDNLKSNMKNTEKKVSIRLFKGIGKYEDDVQVIVNGKAYLIRRGEEVTVPECVSEILKQQEDQLNLAAAIS